MCDTACVSRDTHEHLQAEHEHQSHGHHHGLGHPPWWALPAKAMKLVGISRVLQGLEPGW